MWNIPHTVKNTFQSKICSKHVNTIHLHLNICRVDILISVLKKMKNSRKRRICYSFNYSPNKNIAFKNVFYVVYNIYLETETRIRGTLSIFDSCKFVHFQ